MPKLSVIIPVYGVEKYIERCARSLFGQTYDNIEYLFIDDCTPDHSIEILSQVLEDYPHRKTQVKIHRMENNSGQAAVRKWGMIHATGDYMIHCDSDDWVEPNMYLTMIQNAEINNADVVVCDYFVSTNLGEDRYVKACHSTEVDGFIENLLLQKDMWALWNKMFRSSLLSHDILFPEGNMAEDMAICLQLMLKCRLLSYISRPLYHYFFNPVSISNNLSTDKIMRNFYSVKSNTDIVLHCFSKEDKWKTHTGLLYIQYNTKAHLFPLVHRKKYRLLFKTVYPDLFNKIIIKSEITFCCKVKYVFALIGLYPRKINN